LIDLLKKYWILRKLFLNLTHFLGEWSCF